MQKQVKLFVLKIVWAMSHGEEPRRWGQFTEGILLNIDEVGGQGHWVVMLHYIEE